MSSALRSQRRRLRRQAANASPPHVIVAVAVPIPAGIQPWERELLLPYVQELLEGMLQEALADDDEQDEG